MPSGTAPPQISRAAGPIPPPNERLYVAGLGRAGVLVVVRVDLGELLPLVRHLVLGEAGVDGAGLHAGVTVDALVRIDVQHLDRVVIGLVGRRVDAVVRADLYARVVLGADARLGDDVCHLCRMLLLKSGSYRIRSGGGRRNHTSNRSLPAGHGGWLRAPCVWLADGGARQTRTQPVTRGSATRSG